MNVITMTTKTTTHAKSYNGFAIPLEDDTDLGLAMLVVEDEEGHYETVANAKTINEAIELAADDQRRRRQCFERDEDAGLCSFCYKLWARGIGGAFRVAHQIQA